MKITELKVSRIGNSRGVRLPAETLRHYGIGNEILMEERSDGILLRPLPLSPNKLGWAETAQEMAIVEEDWEEWDSTLGDGLETL